MASATQYDGLVQSLFLAYFGRPVNQTGLASYAAALQAADPTGALVAGTNAQNLAALSAAYGTNSQVAAIINTFGSSTESTTLYGGANASSADFINSIFTNILGRSPAIAGLTGFTTALANGQLTMAEAALQIIADAANNTATYGTNTNNDANIIANKLAVATAFTTSLSTTADVLAYEGSTAFADARALLAGVTPNLTAAQVTTASTTGVASTLGTIVNLPSSSSTTFTLTTTPDSTYVGTSSNNVFNAVVNGTTTSPTTLVAFDTITGGSGTNTLNIVDYNTTPLGALAGTTTAVAIANAAATITGITTLNISALEAVGALNLTTGFAGLTAFNATTTGSGSNTITAAGTTAVSLTDSVLATNTDSVFGGKSVNVADQASRPVQSSLAVPQPCRPARLSLLRLKRLQQMLRKILQQPLRAVVSILSVAPRFP